MKSFELIVVDDGSDDGTAGVLAEISDPRVRVLLQPHLGRVPALNHAVAQCRAPYIANLDADDVACRDRLALSVDFLDATPGVVAMGSAREPYLAPPGRPARQMPTTDRSIRWTFLLRNPMFNSSVTYRADALRAVGGFSMTYADRLHDADVLIRLAKRGQLNNIKAPLSLRRLHEHQHFAGVAEIGRASCRERV